MCPQRCINLSSCSNIVPFVAFPLSDTLHSYRLVEEVQRLRASAIEKDALIAEINEQVHHYSSSHRSGLGLGFNLPAHANLTLSLCRSALLHGFLQRLPSHATSLTHRQ